MQEVAAAPGNRERKALLAVWLGKHGEAEECLRNYAGALGNAVDSAPVNVAAARALVAGGHAELALPLCRRAAALARHSPDAQEALGDALLNLRKVEEAATAYNRAIRLDPGRSRHLISRLRAFVGAHQKDPDVRTLQIAERTMSPATLSAVSRSLPNLYNTEHNLGR